MAEMSRAWFEEVGETQARHTLRYILRRILLPDGAISMTQGYDSDLTTFFTNFLNGREVFRRNGLLTKREREICLDKFGHDKTNKELERIHFYDTSQINRIVMVALDKILEKACAD